MTVELVIEVPLSFAFIDLPLSRSCLAALESLTLSIVEMPSARLKEALPIWTVLVWPPRLILAVRLSPPLQAPPEQVILRAAFPFLTRAEGATLAWPGGQSETLVAQVGCGLALKVAVTAVLSLIVTMQLATLEQPPPEKPEKVEPAAAEAVRLIFIPCS